MANESTLTFGRETTADEVLASVDLTGKTALITGATSGLGLETARALASRGARVILSARDLHRGAEIALQLRETTKNSAISVINLNLASLDSVREFANRFLDNHRTLHLLFNNAGVMATPFSKTNDGFEMQFGTNHLGHFLLTNLLMPALLNSSAARIISLSSWGHHLSPVVFDDIHFAKRHYDKWLAYGQSKTANILFTVELERRLHSKGLHAYAVHPGAIRTALGRHLSDDDRERLLRSTTISYMKTVAQGAATSVYTAIASELEGRGGLYLEDCAIADVVDRIPASKGVMPYAVDIEAAQKLWTQSENMVGQIFPAPS